MPDYTYHISQHCGQLSQSRTFTVPSSSINANYTVYLGADGSEQCTCPGFKFHGHCKHLAAAHAQRCEWDLEHSTETQSFQQNVEMICPVCGGPTVLQKVAA